MFREYCFGRENSLSSAANSVSSAKKTRWVRFGTKNRLRRTHWVLSPELGEGQKNSVFEPWSPKPYSARFRFKCCLLFSEVIILGNASLFTKFVFTISVPLNPLPPIQQSDGFPLEFLLKGPQAELRTLSQNCEQTVLKLQTNRIMNKRAFLKYIVRLQPGRPAESEPNRPEKGPEWGLGASTETPLKAFLNPPDFWICMNVKPRLP